MAGSGCSATKLSHTIDEDRLREASRQGQLWVYDAENGIIVALDRLDEARDELRRIRRELKQSERMIDRAEKRRSRLGVDAAEAWRTHLEALEVWGEANIRLQRLGVLVSKAVVELAKAQVIQREDLLGGNKFSVKDYVEQHQRFKKLHDKRRRIARKRRQRARKLESRWWAIRRRYVAKTGDHDKGLWID